MNNAKHNLNNKNMSHNDVLNTCDMPLPSAKQFQCAFPEHLIHVQNIYTQLAIMDKVWASIISLFLSILFSIHSYIQNTVGDDITE